MTEKEKKTRPMTIKELLAFVEYTTGIVVRGNVGYVGEKTWTTWKNKQTFGYTRDVKEYQWATIDRDGNIGEPQEFVKEV